MFIERLTLKNFKSFGGQHELSFARGFTAIVGPNGSGKSNILDGLRWVLGESSAARLRINRQSDLVFQGSAGLPEAEETDVLLDLSDGDRRGKLRRHLDGTGSTLYVEGQRTRVQDLSQFKQNWHLEGDRSAFIGQGEVTDAILQKPFQRRLRLEELFGIDLYRKKRDDALDEMKQTEAELLRLHTLMGELQTRRDEIAPELQNAQKAKDYQERLENLRGVLYHNRRFSEERRLITLQARHETAQASQFSAENWAKLWKRSVENLRERGSEYVKLRGQLGDELAELTPRIDDIRRREMEVNSERHESEFASRRCAEESQRLKAELAEDEKLRSEAAAQAGSLGSEAAALENQIQDIEDRMARKGQKLNELRRRRQSLIDREAQMLEEARQQSVRMQTLGLQSQEREKVLDDLRLMRDKIVSGLTESDEILEASEDRLEALEKERSEASALCQELAIRAQSFRRAIAKAEADLESMLQTAEAGLYPKPVQMVMSAVKLGRLNIETIPAVEAFRCDDKLAPCLEAYLGGRQYWLLTDSMEQARQGIELLKERKGGRATFLPLERCRRRHADRAPAGAGVLGWAIDLVTPEKRWLGAVEHLLGDLLVVKDYATGSRLSAGARFPIVTLDGEVFSPAGTVSGGQSAKSVGAISLRAQIAETEKNIAADKEAQEDVRQRLAAAEKAEAKAGDACAAQRRSVDEQRSKTEALRRKLREQSEELNALLQESSNSKARIEQCRAAVEKAQAAAKAARAEIDGMTGLDEDDSDSSALLELKTKSLLIGERLAAKKSELDRLVHSTADLRRSMINNDEAARKIVQKLAALSETTEEILKVKAEREAEKKSIDARIAELDSHNALAARRMERQLLRSQRSQAAAEARKRDELMARNEIEKTREKLAELIAQSEEKYPYPPEFLPGEETVDKLESSCRYLERSLKELGDVNLGVLSEDQSLGERLSYLSAQLSDVQRGMKDLQNMIRDTDTQAASLFSTALEKIDRRFNELFQRLFGGGEAHLKAQENQELWDAGVEIIARPPGKKSLFLAQLSGGEQSLTALSLLFASMEVARVPLAVLDEVDAALDEVNLTRFAQMVTDYSQRIQLIAMTHRRQTMEHAEVMYGVTMSEPGLSQIVSVRTDQWA